MGWTRSGAAFAAIMFGAQSAIADPSDDVVRARFTTDATAQDVATKACAITRAFPINGRARTWDVSIGGRRCSASSPDPDSIPLEIVITSMGGRTSVTLEASPSEEIPADALKREMTATGSALRDTPAPAAPQQQGRGNVRQTPTKRNGNGAVVAVAATAGGLAVGVTVAIVVVVVSLVAGFVALFTALAKAL